MRAARLAVPGPLLACPHAGKAKDSLLIKQRTKAVGSGMREGLAHYSGIN